MSQLHCYQITKNRGYIHNTRGGKDLTKLDLSQAYLQMKLDAESQKYLVINTHKGLFHYTCLPLGISSASGIFQKAMETLLQEIPHVTVYIDNILITGKTEADHLQTLEKLLEHLAKDGLRAKIHNFKLIVPSVDYLEYVINARGLRPQPNKVVAIQQAPAPLSVTGLKTHLGLLSYYGKFLPNL